MTKLFFITLMTSICFNSFAQTTTAEEKIENLWSKVVSESYSAPSKWPTKNPGTFDMLSMFRVSYLLKTFNHRGDILPVGRKKLIHTYSAMTKVLFVPNSGSHPFGGILKTGGAGLGRFSVARMGDNFTPGMALKFPVTGKDSVDVIAMFSVDGQGSNKNFFANEFSNIVPESKSAALALLGKAFQKTARTLGPDYDAERLGVNGLNRYSQTGLESKDTPFLYKVIFRPTDEVKDLIDTYSRKDFRADLIDSIKGVVKLYHVYGETREGDRYLLGELRSIGGFRVSKFGDEKLFFRHIPLD